MPGQVKVRLSQNMESRQRNSEEFKILTKGMIQKNHENSLGVVLLKKIAVLLEKMPDIFTLWNYRREILSNINSDFSFSKLYENELNVTARCLIFHPKSYSTWHHRCWVMLNNPCPNWNAERDLCTLILNEDDKNIHCWNYRHFIRYYSKISSSIKTELKEESIDMNFSNYSVWHNKSQILGFDDSIYTTAITLSFPPGLNLKNIKGTSLSWNELDLIHNAIFTDPIHQSPWLYYWWMLGRGEKNAYLREIYLSRTLQRAILVFTAPKLSSAIIHLRVIVNISSTTSDYAEKFSPKDLGGWKNSSDNSCSEVWYFELPKDLIESRIVSVTVYTEEVGGTSSNTSSDADSSKSCLNCQMQHYQSESLTRVELDPRRLLNPIVSAIHEPSLLLNELDIVRELVSMDTKNKWALLTLVSFLRYIRPDNFEEEVSIHLETLRSVDSLKTLHYNDMLSALRTEDAIIAAYSMNSRSVNLANSNLTRICCLDWFTLMTYIDFSHNDLNSLPETFSCLVCLEYLNLDGNRISSLKPIASLPLLRRLSICNNLITNFEGLEPALSCPRIRDLAITGNAVAELENFTLLLSGHPGSRQSQHSLNVIYNKPVTLSFP